MADATVSHRSPHSEHFPLFDREIWKPIPGRPGYEASTLGRIRSWWEIIYKTGVVGGIARIGCHSTVLQGTVREGYVRVNIKCADGKCRRSSVHCLVLETFVGPCPKGMVCRHYPDQDKTNNRLSNLQWGTRSENANDTTRHNLAANQKLTPELVKEMWPMIVRNESGSAIARIFGVSPQIVCDIKHYRCWSDVTKHLPGLSP